MRACVVGTDTGCVLVASCLKGRDNPTGDVQVHGKLAEAIESRMLLKFGAETMGVFPIEGLAFHSCVTCCFGPNIGPWASFWVRLP